jgi:hypothetical protein
MPKLAFISSFVVYIFAYDVQERLHVHVAEGSQTAKKAAKFWLEPTVELFDAGSLSEKELRIIRDKLVENRELLIERIRSFAAGIKSKPVFL